jgi:hypothetical protein
MEIEKELFVPYIAGSLGKSKQDAVTLQKKITDYKPTAKVVHDPGDTRLLHVNVMNCRRKSLTLRSLHR